MPKYNVHLFATVRVKVKDVEAESQSEAVREAQENVDLYHVFDGQVYNNPVESVEWTEEITEVLVDEVGDVEYSRSAWYNPNGTPLIT